MKIAVNEQIHLSEFRPSDKSALIEHLNDRDIYNRTLRIPYPYTENDADDWLALVAKITQQQRRPVNFAVRNADEALIGGCGFDGFHVGKSHRAEMGYWLAKPYWGLGIMTAVIQRLCKHAFEELGLIRSPLTSSLTIPRRPVSWRNAVSFKKVCFVTTISRTTS